MGKSISQFSQASIDDVYLSLNNKPRFVPNEPGMENFFGCGLENRNNLCYLNSGMQLLLNTPKFVSWCRDVMKSSKDDELAKIFLDVFNNGRVEGHGNVAPVVEFYRKMKQFVEGQDDASKFLSTVLNGFKHPCDLFQWCSAIKLIARDLDLEKLVEMKYDFESPCGGCVKAKKSVSTESITNLPNNLLFHISRDPGETYVFPQTLALGDSSYRLTGCVVRSGRSFFSYVLNETSGEWWRFNDLRVKRDVDESEVVALLGPLDESEKGEREFAKRCEKKRIHVAMYSREAVEEEEEEEVKSPVIEGVSECAGSGNVEMKEDGMEAVEEADSGNLSDNVEEIEEEEEVERKGMRIVAMNVVGRANYSVKYHPDEKILDLIKRVAKLTGDDPEDIIVIFAGRRLEPDTVIKSFGYELSNATALNVIVRKKELEMEEEEDEEKEVAKKKEEEEEEVEERSVAIQCSNGSNIRANFRPSDSIRHIKLQVREQLNIDLHEQVLICAGRVLDDESSISDFDIEGVTSLTLVVKEEEEEMKPPENENLRSVAVQCGSRYLTVEYYPSETIFSVKKRLKKLLQVDPNKQIIVCAGRKLDDDATMKSYGVENVTAISLIVKQ